MSAAVGIRVAQAAGGGERSRARQIGLIGMALTSLWSVLFTALLLVWGEGVAAQFVADPEVVAVAAMLFVVWGLLQLFDGMQSVGVGVLRGLFDNRYPTVVSLLAYARPVDLEVRLQLRHLSPAHLGNLSPKRIVAQMAGPAASRSLISQCMITL